MHRLSVVVFSILVGATLAMPAAAQWKWRGPNGQIQYSDLPPPHGVPDKDILQRPTASQIQARPSPVAAVASAPTPPAPKGVDPALEAKRRQAEQEQEAKAKVEEEKVAAAKAENCTRARGHLRTLEDGIRIARTTASGEREILDDKGRAEETRRTQEIIASNCQ